MMNKHKLIEQCAVVLKQNDLGAWTRPAPGLYPHQWLWDSCFIAIGLAHLDTQRAQLEIDSLFRGQWKNGMIPHIIHGPGDYYADNLWKKGSSRFMPEGQMTSGITQPPLIAEAMVRVGATLSAKNRREWYRHHFNQLVAYHEWLYRERDPKKTGLVALVHPWESGIDNSPSWMHQLHRGPAPLWARGMRHFRLESILEMLRRDTKYVPAAERVDTFDAILLYHHVRKLIKANFNDEKILKHSKIALYDVLYNSILIRANQLLLDIADDIQSDIPDWLTERFKLARTSLDTLWNSTDQSYYDRSYRNGKSAHLATIGRYLPLYSGAISQTRAKTLAKQIQKECSQSEFPISTVPVGSRYFSPNRYWQGPTWLNTNWLIIDGLNRYGFHELAEELSNRSLRLVSTHGPSEYFSPLNGTPAGAHQFSWTAALAIDLAYSS